MIVVVKAPPRHAANLRGGGGHAYSVEEGSANRLSCPAGGAVPSIRSLPGRGSCVRAHLGYSLRRECDEVISNSARAISGETADLRARRRRAVLRRSQVELCYAAARRDAPRLSIRGLGARGAREILLLRTGGCCLFQPKWRRARVDTLLKSTLEMLVFKRKHSAEADIDGNACG